MTVIIEYVLIDNFVIDFLLLKLSLKINRVKVEKLRISLSALMGAIFSLLYPALGVGKTIESVVKVLFGCLMTVVVGKYVSVKQYCTTTITFVFATFLTGGAIIGMGEIFGINVSSTTCIALMILPVCALLRLVEKLVVLVKKSKNMERYGYQVEIEYKGVTVRAQGFLDTGNSVYDGVTPVVFCAKSVVNRFLEKGIVLPMKKISVGTVNGEKERLAFVSEKFVVMVGEERKECNEITVCVVEKIDGMTEILLHSDIVGEMYDKENNGKVKEVS